MSPRTGRPKAENPKDIRYSLTRNGNPPLKIGVGIIPFRLRIDAETEKKLKEYCQKHEITKGEAIRRGVHVLLNAGE